MDIIGTDIEAANRQILAAMSIPPPVIGQGFELNPVEARLRLLCQCPGGPPGLARMPRWPGCPIHSGLRLSPPEWPRNEGGRYAQGGGQ